MSFQDLLPTPSRSFTLPSRLPVGSAAARRAFARVIDEDGVLLRHFELDPSVNYQAKSRDIV